MTKEGMTVRMFPILWPYEREIVAELERRGCPKQVPWELVAVHAAQCEKNHRQSPERLAERGGLALAELVAVLEDRPWHSMEETDAFLVLRSFL